MGLFGRKRPQDTTQWAAPETAEQIPASLADLAMFALDHALFSIEEGGPLIPLVLAESAAGRNGHRFLADTLEDGLAQARRFVGTDAGWRRAALAYDGYLTRDGDRRDAIYVLAWDRDTATAVSVAHRYVPGQPDRPLERVGDPLYLGAAPPPGA